MLAYQIVALVLTMSYLGYFLFYLYGWITLPEFRSEFSAHTTRVSIVIAARNEAGNISLVLTELLRQSYPSKLFEVIVVDDHSDDNTVQKVSPFLTERIKLVSLKEIIDESEKIVSFKKRAIEAGISKSDGELIVTTDADCRMGTTWLETLVSFYESTKAAMIVSPVMINESENLLGKFQALDLAGLMGIAGATLHLGFPTMCNGANLAFRRNVFDEVKGYQGINNKSSGDDMLLMHKIARKQEGNVKFLKSRKAVVETNPLHSLRSLLIQRMRWTSKSGAYDDRKIQINLLLVYLFNLSIVLSFIACFWIPGLRMLFFFQMVTKLVLDFVFLSEVTYYFARRKLMWLFLPMEVLHIFYIIVVGFAGNFFATNWKGRKVI
jgi:cellulose synthase/poly-beta-1,6-N-acetylglucosamine synthase-like glycosyltransferase